MRARCEACAVGRDAVALVAAVRVDGLPTWPDRPVCRRCLAAAVVAAYRSGGAVAVQWFDAEPVSLVGGLEVRPMRVRALRLIRGGLAVAALLLLPALAQAAVIRPAAGHCGCTLAELPRVVAVDPGYGPELLAAEVAELRRLDDLHEPEPELPVWWCPVRPAAAEPVSVPEPGGVALVALAALAWWCRR
jgi:MYXO-CTERM domain-containing protein